MRGNMKLSGKYGICEIMDEIYLVPDGYAKSDMNQVEKLSKSAADILKELAAGISSLEELQDKICSLYGVTGEDGVTIRKSVKAFVESCIQKNIIEQ